MDQETTMKPPNFLQYSNGHPFEPKPDCVNHMCHWAPWGDHFKHAEGDAGVLANMLGYSLEENARLLGLCHREGSARTKLFFAFIELVDKLCWRCARKPVPFGVEGETSIRGAWASIQQINKWRKKNKLNIREVEGI